MPTLANLHELRLLLPASHNDSNEDQLGYLAQCNQLRVLQLSLRDSRRSWERLRIPLFQFECSMLQRLLPSWPAIEKIRISVDLQFIQTAAVAHAASAAAAAAGDAPTVTPLYDPTWAALAACRHLRVLELPLQFGLLAHQLAALRSLPSFRSLELSFRGTVSGALPAALLSSMAASESWFNLHLHALPPQPKHVDFMRGDETTGLKQQLAALPKDTDPRVLRRLRVHSHSERKQKVTVECFRIEVDETTGVRSWTNE